MRISVVFLACVSVFGLAVSCGSSDGGGKKSKDEKFLNEGACKGTENIVAEQTKLVLKVPLGALYAQNTEMSSAVLKFQKADGSAVDGAVLLSAKPEMKCCGGTPDQDDIELIDNGDGSFDIEKIFFNKAGEWLLQAKYCAQGKAVVEIVEFPVKAE